MRILRLLMPFIILLSTSCSNDFEVIAPHDEMPLVYCVLDQKDSIHVLRIERAFAGEGNALDMAKISDSIYYKRVSVTIERWKDREYVEDFEMHPTENVVKDTGIFAREPHVLYQSAQILDPASEYRLKLNLPDKGIELAASTFLVGSIKLTKPAANQPSLSFANTDANFEVEWRSASHARVYFLQFRFNYLEVHGRDTAQTSAMWSIAHFTSNHSQGGELMETLIQNRRFYQWLGAKIPPPERGVKRIVPKKNLDIVYTIGGEELYTYMEVQNSGQNPMVQKPVYTNIENGIGLFSSRTTFEVPGKALSYASIDSIAHGQYTSFLGFVDTQDDYYRK